MFAGLFNFLTGGVIRQIGDQINQAYQAKLAAQNDSDRIEADKVIAELESRKAVLVAESRYQWNIAFRAFLASPFGLYMAKVLVWDKMFGFGSTPDLTSNQWKLAAIVYGFYFVYETAQLFKR